MFLPGDGGDDGAGPRVVTFAGDGPVALAIFGFKGGDEASFFGSDDDNEGLLIENRSGAVAEFVGGLVVARRFRPDDLTDGRDGGDFDFLVVLKDDKDVCAIPLCGLGRGAVFFVKVLRVSALMDDFLPENFASLALDRDEGLGSFFLLTGGEVECALNDDRGGVSASGNGPFPAHVFFAGPLGDGFCVGWSVVVFIGTAPLWPIAGEG